MNQLTNMFTLIESMFLSFRSHRLSFVAIMLTPLAIIGTQHLMIGRYKQFLLYSLTFSLFGIGWLIDWLMLDVYHREYLQDVANGRLKGPVNDWKDQATKLVNAHKPASHTDKPIKKAISADSQYQSVHQSNRRNSTKENDASIIDSNDSSIGLDEKSLHTLLDGDELDDPSINQSIDQSIQSMPITNHKVVIEPVTKIPLIDPLDQPSDHSNHRSIIPPSPKVVIQSAEMASPVDHRINQSTNQMIDLSPAVALDLLRAEDALTHRRQSVDHSKEQAVEQTNNQQKHDADAHEINQSIHTNRPSNQSISKSDSPSIQPINNQSIDHSAEATSVVTKEGVSDNHVNSQMIDQSAKPVSKPTNQSSKQKSKKRKNRNAV